MEISRELPNLSPGKLGHVVSLEVPSQALRRVVLPQEANVSPSWMVQQCSHGEIEVIPQKTAKVKMCGFKGTAMMRMKLSKSRMSPCSTARSPSFQLGSKTSSSRPSFIAFWRSSPEESTSQLLMKICSSQPCKRPFPVRMSRSISLPGTFLRVLLRIMTIVILNEMLSQRLRDGVLWLTLTVRLLLGPKYTVSSRWCRDASNREPTQSPSLPS